MKHRLIPFILLLFISLLAGYASGNSIYYILFFTLIFIAILSIVSLVLAYTQFNYLQKIEPKDGIKGQTVELDMQIHNDFVFPLPNIEIQYDLPDSSLNLYKTTQRIGVYAKSHISIKKKVYCRYMGKWPLGISKVRLYDVFGLFCATLDFYKGASYKTYTLIVKPRIVNLDYLPLPHKENISTKNPIQKSTTAMAEIKDIRKYEYGDILKKIHWKLSMARQELMVKNYSQSLDTDTHIYVDCSSHGLKGILKIELEDMIAECSVAVSKYLLDKSMPTKLIIVGKEDLEYTGRSPEDFHPMYEGISNITFDYNFSLFDLFSGDAFTSSNVNSVFFITHSLDTKAFDKLSYMREAGINITLILIKSSSAELDAKTIKIISELSSSGIAIIHISPNEDLNECIKEQAHEKKII